MEYSAYYVIPTKEVDKLSSLPPISMQVDDEALENIQLVELGPDKKWFIWVPEEEEDETIPQKVDVALYFENHEWASWQFRLYYQGKDIASGCFGENDESGVSLEDNYFNGDLKHVAEILQVDETNLKKILTAKEPNVEHFAELIGFEIIPVTPNDLQQIEEDD